MDTTSLVVGAVGGIATLVVKYMVDRFAEAHKSALGVAAKRRERFYEKQAMVIAGIHHKLSRCVEDMSELYFYGDEAELEPIMSQAVENQLTGKLARAKKSFASVEAFHEKYGLYLPESIDQSVSRVIERARVQMDQFEFAFAKGFDDLEKKVVDDIQTLRFDNILLLIKLQTEFRRLLIDVPQDNIPTKMWRRVSRSLGWVRGPNAAQANDPTSASAATLAEPADTLGAE